MSPNSFFAQTNDSNLSGIGIIITFIASILIAFVGIWTIVIQSKAIGEVHQFSSWKGFFTLLIPSIIIAIIVFIVVVFI